MAEASPFAWAPAAATLLSGLMSVQGGADAAAGSRQAGDSAFAAGERAAQAAEDAGARQAESELIRASRAKQARTFEAQQLEQQAGQQAAVAQRQAVEERRQAKLVQSRAIAVAAASGAGASDPTVINLVSRLAGDGTYRANLALYQGDERARLLRMQAAGKNYEALTAEEAGGLNAADDLAKWNATAAAERAKGEAAREAADINARTALNRGNIDAARTLLPAAGALFSKYSSTQFDATGWGGGGLGITKKGYETNIADEDAEAGANMRSMAADKTTEAEYADRIAAEAWAKDQVYGEFTQDGWTVDPDVEWASAVNDGFEVASAVDAAASSLADFDWLMLI